LPQAKERKEGVCIEAVAAEKETVQDKISVRKKKNRACTI
jgi:hypothetical protein